MTTSPHIVPGRISPSLDLPAIEIRWSAVRGTTERRVAFVLSVQPIDTQRALVASAIETPTEARDVMGPRPMRCTIEEDGDLLHLDARIDGRRVIAISYEPGTAGGDDCRLLYAQCSFLAENGFAPGGFDPPELVLSGRI